MDRPLIAVAPKVAALFTKAEEDPLAFFGFPSAHSPKLRSTDNLEPVSKEIAPRSGTWSGIFPDEDLRRPLVDALLIEQNDEWLLTRGYLSVPEVVGELQAAERANGWLHHFLRLDSGHPFEDPVRPAQSLQGGGRDASGLRLAPGQESPLVLRQGGELRGRLHLRHTSI